MMQVSDPHFCPAKCAQLGWADLDLTLFEGFSNQDINVREEAYRDIKAMMVNYMEGFGSPPGRNGTHLHSVDPAYLMMAQRYVPTLNRLSVQCPLLDVRQHCSKLLQLIQETSGTDSIQEFELDKRGPSLFIPTMNVVPVDSQEQEVREIFIEAFQQDTRLDHLTQVMGFHPRYLGCFLKAQNTLMREDGSLPATHRHYLAIIAAARHQCTYLMHMHTNEFLQCGGDSGWLEALENVPKKLQKLQEINRLLAHRPWLITHHHIEHLCRTGSADARWSLTEVMHALILLTHYHSLCSAVFGCGINFELDDNAGRVLHSDDDTSSDSEGENSSAEQLDNLLSRLKQLQASDTQTSDGSQPQARTYEDIAQQNAELAAKNKGTLPVNLSHVIEQPEFTHADFVKRADKSISTFRASDYSWETHGFSIASQCYSDMANILEEKFKIAQELTYNTIGEKYTNINTQEYRTAIWNYIHCIMGIKHDDYNYNKVNQLLERGFKSFIKLVICHPERVTKRDFNHIMKGFTYSEKIHVTIILLEARMQAELLYALRAMQMYSSSPMVK